MKSRYPIVDLGRHVQQVSLRNRADSNIEVFSVTNSDGFTRSTDYFSKEVFSKDVSNYKVVRPGQFAYNPSRINVGSIDYLRHNSPVLVSPLYVVFESDKSVHANYLLRYLKSAWGNSQIRANTEGAVRDSLKFKGLESIKIPLPQLDDQKHITCLLDKVEGLVVRRKQHLQQLDDLLKSVFLEMFGDQVKNEKGWEILSIGSISEVQGGLQVTTKRQSHPIEVPYLRVANVYRDKLDLTEIKWIRVTDAELERVRLKKGDLLIVEGHGNPEEIGRSAVWNGAIKDCVHQNHLIRVRVNIGQLTEIYTSFFINSAGGRRQMFKAGKTTSGLNTISSKNVKEIKITVPPIDLQNQFAAIVEKVEGLKSRYQQSLTDLETLYGALSQKAFKGELDLSRVLLEPATSKDNDSLEADNIVIEPSFAASDNANAPVSTPEGRKDFLKQCFSNWLAVSSSANLSFSDFVQEVQLDSIRLWGEDDFIADLTLAEYDLFKEWLFEAINTERIEQTRNTIEVDGKPDFGNQIRLRRRDIGI